MLAGLNFVNFLLEVAVRAEQIEPAVEVVVEKENPELQQQPAGLADPFGDGFVAKIRGRILRDIKRGRLVGEISYGDAQLVVVPIAAGIDAHGAARVAEVVEG